MTDTSALLRAVLENPEDDLPRLVFADWLDEAGGRGPTRRAAWIRLRCELDRLPDPGDGPDLERYRALCEAANRLWDDEWARDLDHLTTFRRWSRGFVDRVESPLRVFMANAAFIFAANPVTSVRLTDRRPWLRSSDGAWLWFNARPDERQFSDVRHIPQAVWNRGDRIHFIHHTRADADAALSDACVAYGRDLVGLSPLPAPVPA